MKFDKVQFVYIDTNYLEYLHSVDSEIFLINRILIINLSHI